ncbi:MAG: hypothetical protein JNK11_17555 [Alphaproteobacteria bacterium]|nr:hypothetical protein [Alphaproteobacteria bacterium]
MIFAITIESVERSNVVRAGLADAAALLARGSTRPVWTEAARTDAYNAWMASWTEPGETFFPALRLGLLFSEDPMEPMAFHIGGDTLPALSLGRLASVTESAVTARNREGLVRRFLPPIRHLRLVKPGPDAGPVRQQRRLAGIPGS